MLANLHQDDCQDDQFRVLLVDDVTDNLDVLIEQLQNENLDLLVATSGEEGLALARRTKPDLILLDVMMPDIDGYTVCERLKCDITTRDIPIVFLSAQDNEKSVEYGLTIGAVDYISKPFSLPILKARLRNHLALKRKSDMLEKLACMDFLTGVANRGHFEICQRREWARAQRDDNDISYIMIDIDHFKAYNDNYGHNAGDDCLRMVARALNSVFKRPSDLLARYGGEEFIGMLPGVQAAQCRVMAEKLCNTVRDLRLQHAYSSASRYVSISVGWASGHSSLCTNTNLLKCADLFLYQAKHQGRNQARGGLYNGC